MFGSIVKQVPPEVTLYIHIYAIVIHDSFSVHACRIKLAFNTVKVVDDHINLVL